MTRLEIALILAGLLCFGLGVFAGLQVRSHRRDEQERNRPPGILWKQHIVKLELANACEFQRKRFPDEAQDEAAFKRVEFWLEAMYAEQKLPP